MIVNFLLCGIACGRAAVMLVMAYEELTVVAALDGALTSREKLSVNDGVVVVCTDGWACVVGAVRYTADAR